MNRPFRRPVCHLAVAGVAVLTLPGAELPTLAQKGPVPAAATGAGGRGFGGRGGGRGGHALKPSALRAVPAETTAAKVKDPNWKATRTAGGHPDLDGMEVYSGGQVEGRQPVRELGFSK